MGGCQSHTSCRPGMCVICVCKCPSLFTDVGSVHVYYKNKTLPHTNAFACGIHFSLQLIGCATCVFDNRLMNINITCTTWR